MALLSLAAGVPLVVCLPQLPPAAGPDGAPPGLCPPQAYPPPTSHTSMWLPSQVVPCIPRAPLRHLHSMVHWPTRRLAPTLAKGGAAFLTAYSALAELAADSPRVPLSRLATPDVDLVTVVTDGRARAAEGVQCAQGAATAWDVTLHALQEWENVLPITSSPRLQAAVAGAFASLDETPALGHPPLSSFVPLLLVLHGAVPRTTAPEHATPSRVRRHEAELAVRGACVAAGALLEQCRGGAHPHGVPPDQWAALADIIAQPVHAFDAMCDVGSLEHTVGGILSQAPQWFRVPTYGEGYMDSIPWLSSADFVQVAWNASQRYDLLLLPSAAVPLADAAAAVSLYVPGWGQVVSPAVLVGHALDTLSCHTPEVRSIRRHPGGDALPKLRRRLARVRHAVAVHAWLTAAAPRQVASLPPGWVEHFTLSDRLLSVARGVEAAVAATPLEGAPCFAVLVEEGGDEDPDAEEWYSDEPIACEHPAAYLDTSFLPLGLQAFSTAIV